MQEHGVEEQVVVRSVKWEAKMAVIMLGLIYAESVSSQTFSQTFMRAEFIITISKQE